jgi:hypothetical protein
LPLVQWPGSVSDVDDLEARAPACRPSSAHLDVSAIGQRATAEIEVKQAEIRVEVHLPWLLAAMASKVDGLLKTNAQDTLRIGTTKKV